MYFEFTNLVVTIGFNRAAYSVSEDAGSVSVTVSVQTGALGRDVVVTLSTINGTALCESETTLPQWIVSVASLSMYSMCSLSHSVAGMDYEAITTTLTFNGSISTQMVAIPILDDQIVENSKSFGVTLTTIDTAVTLRSQTTRVTIRDNDSKLHCAGIHMSCCLTFI